MRCYSIAIYLCLLLPAVHAQEVQVLAVEEVPAHDVGTASSEEAQSAFEAEIDVPTVTQNVSSAASEAAHVPYESERVYSKDCDPSVFAGDSWKSKLTYKEKLIAGSIARFTGQSIMHPIEVVKSRVQARGMRGFRASSLIKGIIAQVGLSIPAGAIQFSSIEFFKEFMSKQNVIKFSPDVKNFLAGVGGTFMAMCLRVPQEVLKQGCQTEIYDHFGQAVSQIYTRAGIGGFYRGFWAQVARDLPWSGLSFMLFGMGKKFWEGVVGRVTTEDENMLIGAIGGGIAGALTNPIDVLKTRIMTQRAGEIAKYRGVTDAFTTIVAEEGFSTLFRGVVYRVLYLAPFSAVLYTAYELAGKELYRRRCEANA